MKFPRIMTPVLLASILPVGAISGQNQGDIDAINELLDRYTELEEAMDMTAQARLMSEDRVWIGPGTGRRTDQGKNMRIQQAQFEVTKDAIPGIQWFVDDTDRLLRFYGNGRVAVVSFFRYSTYIIPASAPPSLAETLAATQPMAMTMVLEKSGGEWKIVHSHISNLNPPTGG